MPRFSLIITKNVFSPCHETLSVPGKVLWILFSSLSLDKELNTGDVIQANSGWEQGFKIGKRNLRQREFISPVFPYIRAFPGSKGNKAYLWICNYPWWKTADLLEPQHLSGHYIRRNNAPAKLGEKGIQINSNISSALPPNAREHLPWWGGVDEEKRAGMKSIAATHTFPALKSPLGRVQ